MDVYALGVVVDAGRYVVVGRLGIDRAFMR